MTFSCRWGVGVVVLFVCLLAVNPVQAVPPPDFLINVGSQMAQFFSLALLFLTAIMSSAYQFFRARFASVRLRTGYWAFGLVCVVALAGVGAALFGRVLERRALVRLEQRVERPAKEALPVEPPVMKTVDLDQALLPSREQELRVVAASTSNAVARLSFKLSNKQLQTLLDTPSSSYLVLDARENIEYEYGQFPGSLHLRFADLKAGRWMELPTDRSIIVLCWSGIRGSQVASFLRDKGLTASYLAEGANGWVAEGGRWQGAIKFAERFPDERYRIAFSKEEMMRRVQGGAILIDAREPKDRTKRPLTTTASIALLSTPSPAVEEAFARLPPRSSIITVCGSYVDCFEAKLVGVEAERRDHVFLGRYLFN